MAIGSSSENNLTGKLSVLDFIPQGFHYEIINGISSVDLSDYIQEWLDEITKNSWVGIWNAGHYTIAKPIWVTKNAFEGSFIEGDGRGYSPNNSQTRIHATHTDGPALIVQYGRGVRISNILIYGDNLAQTTLPEPSSDINDYISEGFRSERYSPQCGIAIDPTIGPIPPDGGYPGLQDDYTGVASGGSADVVFENVGIQQCVVGLMCSPSGGSTQGDGIRFIEGQIKKCAVGASYGQSQSRACFIRGGDMTDVFVTMTTARHGELNGAPPALESLQVNDAYRIVECGDTIGSLLMTNLYGERLKSVGFFGTGVTTIKQVMQAVGCEFKLRTQNTKTAPVVFASYGPASFSGCRFEDSKLAPKAFNFTGLGLTKFNTCAFRSGWTENDDASIANHADSAPFAEFEGCVINSTQGDAFALRTGVTAEPTNFAFVATDINIGATQITFDTVDAGSLSVGQLIYWRMLPIAPAVASNIVPALEIVDITANTITCDMLHDAEDYDATYNPGGNRLALTVVIT